MILTHAKVSKSDFEFSKKVSWIHPEGAESGDWYLARREFSANGERTLLALLPSYYAEAYINGKLAARFSERSYIFDIQYKVIDISDFVVAGKNTLVILYRETGEAKRCGFAAEITSDNETVLVSDTSFKFSKYTPFQSKANFYIEGAHYPEIFDARLDDFAPSFLCGYDDSKWQSALIVGDKLTHEPFDSIHQDKLELQTENAVYAKRFVSFEKSLSEDGTFVKFPGKKDSKIIAETEISFETDSSFALDSFGGTEIATLDGNIIAFKENIDVKTGSHRLAVYGSAPNIFIKGSAFSLSSPLGDGEWVSSFTEFKIETPFFPWNGYRKNEKLPENVEEFLFAKSFYSLKDELKGEKTDVISDPNINELISEKKYLVFNDSITDIRLSEKRISCNENLDVIGRDTVFSENASMTLSPSENEYTFILDFDVVQIGGVYFDVTASAGAEITINTFEVINNEGARYGALRQTLKYICKNGRNTYLSHVRRGFRYMLVNVKTPFDALTFNELGLSEWRFPTEDKAKFSCSDKGLCEIYKMSVDTASACMIDAYVDCPGYEQNIWTGDARVTSLVNLNTFGSYDFDERYIELISESLSDGLRRVYRTRNPRYISGRYLTCATFPTFPEGNIPIWSYSWVLSVADHFEYTGDKDALLRMLPAVEESLRRSEELFLNDRGLLSIDGAWNLIEWAYNDVSEYGEITANNMILAYCFKKFSKLEALVGNDARSVAYAKRAEDIKNAINKYCWNEERKAYTDMVRDEYGYEKYTEYYKTIGKTPLSFEDYMALSRISVQTNTFAVLFEIADGKRKESALKILKDSIEEGIFIDGTPARRSIGVPSESEAPRGIVRIGSPFFMYFALKTLFDNGYGELAISSIRREWGNMLDSGITTCTESFNSPKEWKTRSVAHGWSSSPALFLISDVLGIKPLKPGFTEFTVTPVTGKLDFAKGNVPTPYGEINVEWRKDADGNVSISCNAPKECKRVDL